MIYKNFQNLKLSALGLGAMRLPLIDGKDDRIDIEKTAEMVEYAIKNGVNYFDTAWGYHSGNSEIVMGELLNRYPRESYYLASKFPGYDLANMDKVEEIFEKQLEKCKVDYFDFYLFHNVCETNINQYLDSQYRIFDYLMKQKENGRIKHLGFSIHGDMNTTNRFLGAYGNCMEFGQIQLNYIDWEFQDAKAKVELLNKMNIPIWVMEPVRGGRLANLGENIEHRLKDMRPDEETVNWAFRFLQSIDGIGVTLSGMSNIEQLKSNVDIFSQNKPLNENELETILKIGKEMTDSKSLPCTSCRYCVSKCPRGLDIPTLIGLYNEHNFCDGNGFIAPMRLSTYPKDKRPSACIGCRSCEAVCPQNIKISEAMSGFYEIK